MEKKTSIAASTWKNLNLVIPLTALIVTILDIVLLERKYNVFTGGFLQSNQIIGFADRLYFCSIIFLLELSLAAGCWYLLRLVSALRSTTVAISKYQFIVVYGAGSVLALLAKYQVLSYFGDFISLAVLRNLGGGNLKDALLYALEESQLFLLGAAVVGVAALLLYRRLRKRLVVGPASYTRSDTKRHLAGLVAAFTALSSLAYVASNDATAGQNMRAVTPYWFANEFNKLWRPAVQSPLEVMSRNINPLAKAKPSPITFPGRKDNLVLVVSESTRADVMDSLIEGKPATPVFRMLASVGAVANQYYSHTGFTTSSLKAIFNGSLGEDRPFQGSLFEVLKKHGYQIVVLSGQNEAFGDIARDTNMEKMADIFFDARSAENDRVFSSAAAGSLTLSNKRIIEQFDRISSKIDWKRPVFIYVNFQAAHFPYFYKGMPVVPGVVPIERGDISEEKRAQVKLTYLNAVASSDASTGQLVDRLRKMDVFEKTLFVVAGDHGESLFEDNTLGHGLKITDTQMHALLVANRKLPEFASLLGQTQLAASLLKGIGASYVVPPAPLPASEASVIHYIGALKSPVELGYTYVGGNRLVLDNRLGQVRLSQGQKPVKFSALPVGGQTYRELSRLVAEWKSIAFEKNLCATRKTECVDSEKIKSFQTNGEAKRLSSASDVAEPVKAAP
jgi:glucan phosphoethanolaminetransferase (alkaline phosphatase superfamily)